MNVNDRTNGNTIIYKFTHYWSDKIHNGKKWQKLKVQ